jgi:hypothetical protein
MEPKVWFLLVVCIVVGLVVLATMVAKQMSVGRHRPLSHKFHGEVATPKEKPPLGMEATDIASFDRVRRGNERAALVTGSDKGSQHERMLKFSQPPSPIPEDKTYAVRYNDAFGTTQKDQTR